MALAIAVGVPPQQGIYTAIVAGGLVAALGGSRTQVTGPTAAFIVILAPITARYGFGGLLLAGLLGGLMLIVMGLARLGRFIEFIPHPVTTGFTAGIATVIAALQLKDLFGLKPATNPEHFIERLGSMFEARGTASGAELIIGLLTLGILLFFPKVTRRIPAPLVALPVAAVAAAILAEITGHPLATIGSRFSFDFGGKTYPGIPQLPPLPMLPWNAPGPNGGELHLDLATIRELLPGAFAIAMLGAIESLLSAVVADGMARTKHDPDAELLALGVGNVIGPFFGAIPATGAIARTATNIRSGAKSPISAITHSVTIFAAVMMLAPVIAYLPMSALAGLLLLVAWNMSDAKHFVHIVKVAPKSDVTVLLTCYVLTVAFDMVIAVSFGVVLAALLFMRRMAEVTQARITEGEHPQLPGPLPPGVIVYDIAGPLFFGATQKAMGALTSTADRAKVVILRMDGVPAMDATGLVALESSLERLEKRRVLAILEGLQPQPLSVIKKGGIDQRQDTVKICPTIECALEEAVKYHRTPSVAPGPSSSSAAKPA